MKRHAWAMALLLPLLAPLAPAQAAPSADKAVASPARTYPAQVKVRRRAEGFYYADARGMTLYALNQRVAFTRSGGVDPYCTGPCARIWTEAAAPADAKPVGDWSVIAGPSGPQWAYRKNPVFTYAADTAPGQTAGDNYEDLWTVIVHTPPAPSLTAPPAVSARLIKGDYVLTDADGHALFTPPGKGPCARACADWTPLPAGLAARDVGDWTVARDGPRAHWTYRGQAVFVSPLDDPAALPDGGQALRP